MKKALVLVSLFPLLIWVHSALAAPRGISSVTPNHIARLDDLHRQASDFILVNDFASALRVYMDIVLMEPDDETAYDGMGSVYLIQGQTQKAREAFEIALQINPENEVALAGMKKIMDPDGVDGAVTPSDISGDPHPENSI